MTRGGLLRRAIACRTMEKTVSTHLTPLDHFLRGYLICALWSTNDESTPEGGEPMDDNYSIDDIAPATVAKCRSDCEDFMHGNAKDLELFYEQYKPSGGYDVRECAGHDFWLTRNGHGTGFWDRGLDKLGDRLADAARVYKEFTLYVGDDGKIHG